MKKLFEEVQEFAEIGSAEELADVLEVINAIRKLPEYGQEVENIRKQKLEEKGGFEQKFILKGEK